MLFINRVLKYDIGPNFFDPTKSAQGVKSGCRGVHMLQMKPANNPFENSIMILPQVHLRKPCYDLYFL